MRRHIALGLGLVPLALAACAAEGGDGGPTEPDAGVLEVTTVTTGATLDPGG